MGSCSSGTVMIHWDPVYHVRGSDVAPRQIVVVHTDSPSEWNVVPLPHDRADSSVQLLHLDEVFDIIIPIWEYMASFPALGIRPSCRNTTLQPDG